MAGGRPRGRQCNVMGVGKPYVDADAANLTYHFIVIYNQQYWTRPVNIR